MGFLGLGVGKLQLYLEQHDFEAGDWLMGQVQLDLKEPVAASSLKIRLKATQRRRERRRDSQGNERTVQTTVTVFETDLELDGEGTYKPGEVYDFEMRIPQVDAPIEGRGIAQIARALTGQAPLEWSVEARLVQRWKFDVKKAVSIRVI